jgi:hypothetical protein
VSVHIKGATECFECQPKPTPKSYPVCTIRNTPDKARTHTRHAAIPRCKRCLRPALQHAHARVAASAHAHGR